ncbi:MAG: hypothetical protein NC409_13500 [Clostridium sp.]|nr:hypothetical protein [Clostridium sp.]
MRYVIGGISILYAALSMLAAIVQMRTQPRKDTPLMMLGGGILLIAAALIQKADWILAVIGGAMICAAAFLNGKRSGNFHIQHHIIRLALTLILVIGFVMQ